MQKLKNLLTDKLPVILLGLLVIQPPLDVLSYFADRYGLTSITTLLRFGLLALVVLLGFLLTERKRVYLILGAAVAVFWLAHMLNCLRIGYVSPVEDAANLLRLMNFPLYVLTFVTALEGRPQLRRTFYLGAFIAFLEIILFTALPWLLGRPVYTYGTLKLGVLGWFLIPTAQSAVLLAVALMFMTGSKLDYFSIFIIGGAYIFLFLIQLGKKSPRYVLPLAALVVLSAVFRGHSPMAARDAMTASSQGIYGSMISSSLETSGADQATLNIIQSDNKIGRAHV